MGPGSPGGRDERRQVIRIRLWEVSLHDSIICLGEQHVLLDTLPDYTVSPQGPIERWLLSFFEEFIRGQPSNRYGNMVGINRSNWVLGTSCCNAKNEASNCVRMDVGFGYTVLDFPRIIWHSDTACKIFDSLSQGRMLLVLCSQIPV